MKNCAVYLHKTSNDIKKLHRSLGRLRTKISDLECEGFETCDLHRALNEIEGLAFTIDYTQAVALETILKQEMGK